MVVGGGLAPCGLTADPFGDVWVANCYASGSGPSANVVRIDASTLEFKATWRVPAGKGYYRGLAYGGGSLWVTAPINDTSPNSYTLTEIDPCAANASPKSRWWSARMSAYWARWDLSSCVAPSISVNRNVAVARVVSCIAAIITHGLTCS